jgi:hypothetical protein
MAIKMEMYILTNCKSEIKKKMSDLSTVPVEDDVDLEQSEEINDQLDVDAPQPDPQESLYKKILDAKETEEKDIQALRIKVKRMLRQFVINNPEDDVFKPTKQDEKLNCMSVTELKEIEEKLLVAAGCYNPFPMARASISTIMPLIEHIIGCHGATGRLLANHELLALLEAKFPSIWRKWEPEIQMVLAFIDATVDSEQKNANQPQAAAPQTNAIPNQDPSIRQKQVGENGDGGAGH